MCLFKPNMEKCHCRKKLWRKWPDVPTDLCKANVNNNNKSKSISLKLKKPQNFCTTCHKCPKKISSPYLHVRAQTIRPSKYRAPFVWAGVNYMWISHILSRYDKLCVNGTSVTAAPFCSNTGVANSKSLWQQRWGAYDAVGGRAWPSWRLYRNPVWVLLNAHGRSHLSITEQAFVWGF